MNLWEEKRRDINADRSTDAEEKAELLAQVTEDEARVRSMNDRALIQQLEEICRNDDDIYYLYELLRRMGHTSLMTETKPPASVVDDYDDDDCSGGHDFPEEWEWDSEKKVHYRECNRCSEEEEISHEEHGHIFGGMRDMRAEGRVIVANVVCGACGHIEQRRSDGSQVVSRPVMPTAPPAKVEMPGKWIE